VAAAPSPPEARCVTHSQALALLCYAAALETAHEEQLSEDKREPASDREP
jgi:hypothetical protein